MTAKGGTATVSRKFKFEAPFKGRMLIEDDDEEEEEKEKEEISTSVNTTGTSENESATRPSSRLSDKSPESPETNDNALITANVPTSKKSRKRKIVITNFDDNNLLDSATLDAQRKEKERLERLEKIEQTISYTDHIDQVAALNPLPVIDLTDSDFDFDEPPTQSGTSFDQQEVIELSSDDDDIQEVGTVNRSLHVANYRRYRWNATEKEKEACDEMDKQQKLEEERLKKKGHLLKDLDKIDTTGDRLIVNKGHPLEDPDIAVAPHLTRKLQPHQLGGICFMYNNVIESLEEYKRSPGFGCILAHSMGLGKTLQIVTFTEIFFRATNAHKVLIIVPINTIQNWWNEFDKWMPMLDEAGNRIRNFNVFILGDSVKTFDQRVNLLEKWTNEGGVLIIGYDMFRLLLRSTQPKKKKARMKLNFINGQPIVHNQEKPDDFDKGFTNAGRVKKEANELIRQALLDPGPELVVCDEGHKIKNLNTDISMALGAIRTTRRIVLTGYPLQNNLMEYYCMVDFVRPRYLGEKKTFSNMFEKPIKNGSCVDATSTDWKLAAQRTHVLVEKLRGFVQRRTHHLLKTILPQSREYVVLLRKSALQHVLYRSLIMYAQNEIRGGSNVFNPLKAFAACSKIWNHPDVLYKTLETRREKKRKEQAQVIANSNPIMNGVVDSLGLQNMWRTGGNDLDIADYDEETISLKKKPVKKGPTNILSALLEDEVLEMDLETGLKYDWAEIAMGHYQPGILENGYKMKIAIDLIDETLAMGEKILLFSQNLTALDLIEQYLQRQMTVEGNRKWKKNHTYFRLDGSTNGTEREKLIKRFNGETSASLFLISTRAGSLGINLVSANRCIILDACWNPCHDAQAVCRVYRYGQQKETFIYRLIMDNSMEKAIFNRQVSKHGLQQRVVDDAKVDANVTQRELETLLVYDESLDIMEPIWDTSSWDIQDEVLKRVVERNKNMISTEPFLHESLIIEREEGLSEQEKLEARVMFDRERMAETSQSLFTQNDNNQTRSALGGVSRPQWNGINEWPMEPSRQPYKPPYIDQIGMGHNSNIFNNYNQMSMMNNAQISIPSQYTQHQNYPNVSFNNNGPQYQAISYNQQNGNYSQASNGYYQQPGPSFNQQQRRSYIFADGSDAVVGYSFPGALRATQSFANDTGSMQMIVMDRSMVLPAPAKQNRIMAVTQGEEVTLIRSGNAVFLKKRDGTVLDAKGTIFDASSYTPTVSYAMSNYGPDDCIQLD